MLVEEEKPTAAPTAADKPRTSHKGDFEIVPIEQETVQGAYHVHLSWRSWVRDIHIFV